jgi:hypothetical protein
VARFRGYLRSLVLHGLALILQELVVLHGRGNERKVLFHAQLPIQFGEHATDTLSVFEAGDHGDGTVRTFLRRGREAFNSWRRGEWADCPYAAEDALLERLFTREADHARWRRWNPAAPASLRRIAQELTGTRVVADTHLQVIRRALFQYEHVGAEQFDLYDVVRETQRVRQRLRTAFGRWPSAWETVSGAIAAATTRAPEAPRLTAMLDAYGRLDIGTADETLGPRARLADQVYRLSTALCVDGCRGCLHRSSPLMTDEQASLAVSRNLLSRYREFVLSPLTLEVRTDGQLPTRAQVEQCLAQHGACRLLVEPTGYDNRAAELERLGFGLGQYDPLLNKVVLCCGG